VYCLVNNSKIGFVFVNITQNSFLSFSRHRILTSYLQNLFRQLVVGEQCRLNNAHPSSLHQPLQQGALAPTKQPHRLIVAHTKLLEHLMNCRFLSSFTLHSQRFRHLTYRTILPFLGLHREHLINQLNLVGIGEQLSPVKGNRNTFKSKWTNA
jgi:hypothetical protein